MSNWLQNSVDSFNNEDSLDRFAKLWGVQNSELVHRARELDVLNLTMKSQLRPHLNHVLE